MLGQTEFFCCDERAAAEIDDERNAARARELRDLLVRRRIGKSTHEKVALVHAQDEPGLRSDRARRNPRGSFY